MRRMAWLVVLLLASGCKVVDAPETLEELLVFSFVHYEDGPEYSTASADGLVPLVDRHEEELLEGYRVDSLTSADLEEGGVEQGEPKDIVGIAGVVEMVSPLEDIARVLTQPDVTDVFERTLEYEVDPDTDRQCFLDHECPFHHQTGTRVTNLGFFGTATQDFDMRFQWGEREDGSEVLFIRTLAPEPTDISSIWLKIHQNYSLSLIYEDGDIVRRLEANWVDAEVIGLDLPDSVALDSAINGMQQQAAELDAYIQGGG